MLTAEEKSSSAKRMPCFSEEFNLLIDRIPAAFIVEDESDALDHFIVILLHQLLSPEMALGVELGTCNTV